VSLAHGWSTGPTWQLSQHVLGVAPVDAGYRRWVVAPQPGDLRWARGQVPTPYGPIRVSWVKRAGGALHVHVDAPAGTAGSVRLPHGGTATVTVRDHRG
jgi:alpha-L-rhamnosidase